MTTEETPEAKAARERAEKRTEEERLRVREEQRRRYAEKVVTESVDGISYTSAKLPTSKGCALLPDLIALLGEDMIRLIIFDRADLLVESPTMLARVVADVASKARELDIGRLAQRIFERTRCAKLRIGAGVSGDLADPAIFDEHFAGEYGHLAKVAFFVIRHNFMGPSLGSPSIGGSGTGRPTVATEASAHGT